MVPNQSSSVPLLRLGATVLTPWICLLVLASALSARGTVEKLVNVTVTFAVLLAVPR